MVQCWNKSRKSGVEPGPVPHCPHKALHEAVRNKLCTTKEGASV